MSARGLAVVTSLLLVACGAARPEAPPTVTSASATTTQSSSSSPSSASAEAPEPSHAAEMWRSRCNQCHVRVEPQTRDRAVLSQALERHKKRARLSETDVRDLVDYLAK